MSSIIISFFLLLNIVNSYVTFDGRNLYTSTSRSFNTSISHKSDDPNGHQKDEFGHSVAIQNGIALVGAPEDDDNVVAYDAGRVFVFQEHRQSKTWKLIREIEDGEPGDYFGWAIAFHTDLFAVVGACRDHLFGEFSGGAYYMNIQPDPNEEQDDPIRIVQSEKHGGQFFGYTVALGELNSGSLAIVIGAYGHRNRGAVFVYLRQDDGTVGQETILYASDGSYNDRFGWSVDILGNVLVAGAPSDNNQGSAYVFEVEDLSSNSWTSVTKLRQFYGDDDQSNPLVGDYFGMSIAICDNLIAISAPHNDVRGSDAGAVFIYEMGVAESRLRRQLTELLNDYIPYETVLKPVLDYFFVGTSSGNGRKLLDVKFVQTLFSPQRNGKIRFGWSLDYDPVYGRLVVGTDASQTGQSGNAFVFMADPTNYFNYEATLNPVQNIDDDVGEGKDANFGCSVAVHGDYIAVGASRGYGEVSWTGDAYFFTALTRSEYYGHMSQSSMVSETEAAGIGMGGLIFLCLLVSFSIAFCRYRAKGDNEGFTTYLSDSISDAWGSIPSTPSNMSAGHTILEDDDSAHNSSHPMMVGEEDKPNKVFSSSSPSSSSRVASTGTSRTSNPERSKSPGTYPGKASKSRVQLAGLQSAGNAKRQGYAGSLSDL